MTCQSPPLRLVRRADFIACSRGRRVNSAAFVLQERRRDDSGAPRFGFTVTKKTGGAVERNRMRRRLREAVRLGAADAARPGSDYVLVLNRAALDRPFETLIVDLTDAIRRAAKAQERSVARSSS
ncbi:ribonuclease P protein component [Phreatobacter aquaticus]|uniref:Ribonuclease P protein component n=1 Tax=Phreatobacter aquaticus TaxID=2570229 RepID=A0A4D7QK83_9HYPH|nr:ribonuclease P protein component [Phreatobacter aquaticus]QCK85726.1 ribonuclease P protein component [Phreatobacter aquaticus]